MINRNSIMVGLGVFVIVFSVLIYTNIFMKNGYKPKTNDGEMWRIGYYQGGDYKDYQTYLLALVQGLEELRWVYKLDLPPFEFNDDVEAVWHELTQAKSRYIKFMPQAYWSGDWYEDNRAKKRADVLRYLQMPGLDLIIAGGTWAGLDLATNEHSTPVLVISSSDPIKAGIVKSAQDSGFDHVHAVCDPGRYQRQIRAFHNIADFKNLGIVFEDTPDGRIYAALDDALKIAEEKDFAVVTCIASDQGLSEEEAMQGVLRCHEELAPHVDALYITAHRGVNPKWMPAVLKPLFDHKVPTFAQEGPKQVERGVMLSIARTDVEEIGLFLAKTVGYALNGKSIGHVRQIFEEPKRIVINTKAAELIGFKIPDAIVNAAYKVCDEIESE